MQDSRIPWLLRENFVARCSLLHEHIVLKPLNLILTFSVLEDRRLSTLLSQTQASDLLSQWRLSMFPFVHGKPAGRKPQRSSFS